jgi:hypothetical protein
MIDSCVRIFNLQAQTGIKGAPLSTGGLTLLRYAIFQVWFWVGSGAGNLLHCTAIGSFLQRYVTLSAMYFIIAHDTGEIPYSRQNSWFLRLD